MTAFLFLWALMTAVAAVGYWVGTYDRDCRCGEVAAKGERPFDQERE